MKVHLAYSDRDLDPKAEPPAHSQALVDDLGLDVVVRAMAAGDRYLDEIVRAALFVSLHEPDEIRYRQAVLRDCLAHPELVRELYAIAVEALTRERGFWVFSDRYPELVLRGSIGLMAKSVVHLRRLRDLASEHRSSFASAGFRRLFDELIDELDEEYLRSVERCLRRLAFRDGAVLSATVGPTNLDTRYVLRRRTDPRGWRDWVGLPEAESHTWELRRAMRLAGRPSRRYAAAVWRRPRRRSASQPTTSPPTSASSGPSSASTSAASTSMTR